jgi:hypothetical protein
LNPGQSFGIAAFSHEIFPLKQAILVLALFFQATETNFTMTQTEERFLGT